MQLRPFLGIGASVAIALVAYACSDTTFPSQLNVDTPLDGTTVGLTDSGAPQPVGEGGTADGGDAQASKADAGDATFPRDGGDAGEAGPALDGGDSGERDAGDSSIGDANPDASG